MLTGVSVSDLKQQLRENQEANLEKHLLAKLIFY